MKEKINYSVRELTKEDLDDPTDFIETLSNLSEVGDLSPEEAKALLKKMKAQGKHIVLVITDDGKIIGCASILIELKFIHKGGLTGHVEDVATRKGFEGKGVGGALMKKLMDIAKEYNCYKVILDCEEHLIPFYQQFGFKVTDAGMRVDL